MKKDIRHKTDSFATILFVVGIFIGGAVLFQAMASEGLIAPAYAEDDQEGYENEDEDENEREDEDAPSQTSPKTKNIPIYETVLVTKTVTTIDPIFTTDQDKDLLVDGLDPHPAVHEREYFTDDDGDSVANAFDMHAGDDDFIYYEEENDENGDGVLDSYEAMEER